MGGEHLTPTAWADRQAALAEHRGVLAALSGIAARLDELETGAAAGADAPADTRRLVDLLLAREQELFAAEAAARQAYLRSVPTVALSRCPFTGEELRHSVDVFGLEGLWWRYDAPVRPAEQTPGTFLGLTGAMQLAEPVEAVPFLVKPGPAVPCVLPALLKEPAARAVVSSIGVGDHLGVPVVYFSDGDVGALPVLAAWGARHALPEYAAERFEEDDEELDADLARWIEAGKLLWIRPGDASLTLESGVKDCPYLGWDGGAELQRIEDGVVWTPSSAKQG